MLISKLCVRPRTRHNVQNVAKPVTSGLGRKGIRCPSPQLCTATTSICLPGLCEGCLFGCISSPNQGLCLGQGKCAQGPRSSEERAAGAGCVVGPLGQLPGWAVLGEGLRFCTPGQVLIRVLPAHSLPSSAEPPAVCEISPLVSYSGEVSAACRSGVRLCGWGRSGEVGARLERHSTASVCQQGKECFRWWRTFWDMGGG